MLFRRRERRTRPFRRLMAASSPCARLLFSICACSITPTLPRVVVRSMRERRRLLRQRAHD